ncbi:hypothetical protein GC175_06835 [bacterium]|nr:hypothetical protein [bacterium]
MITIKTFGEFDVKYNGVSLLDGTDVKRGLLLTYLWEQHAPMPRLEMARLLWTRVDDNTALVNLRSLLLRLRREGLGDHLDAGRSMLALVNRERIDYDVARIRTLTTNLEQASLHDLTVVAEIYRGPFLQTAMLNEHPQLEEWAATLRTEMEIRAIQALSRLVAQSIALGHADMILSYAEHLISLTPYDDQSQELYLRALASAGRVTDAINHFYQYQRLKRAAFHVDQVENRLSELVMALETSQHPPAFNQTVHVENLPAQSLNAEQNLPHRFPHIEYPSVGRYKETVRLLEMLDKGHRLISVIGVNGTGKTFFVRSQYEQLVARFGNAVYFADLRSGDMQPEQAVDRLFLAVAAVINWTPQPGSTLFEQVVAVLLEQKCCLILDNFETVQFAAPSVAALYKALPGVTILVTSSTQLRLPAESVLMLEGLSQTGIDQQAAVDKQADSRSFRESSAIPYTDAMYYFEQCMQREDLPYPIDDELRILIDSICRRVDGFPLAIELAARQVSYYSLLELATLIFRRPTEVAGTVDDLSPHHQVVWVILDNMWQMLSDNERCAFAELSVFAGAFHRDALLHVVPTSQTVYAGLINASLLHVDEPAWFSLHPIVKAYAAHRLPSDSEVYARHARYFLGMFAGDERVGNALISQRFSMPPFAIRCQADVMSAWRWAIAHNAWNLLDQALLRFSQYLVQTCQVEELIRQMSQLTEQLPQFEQRSRLQHRLAGRAASILGVYYDMLPDQPMTLWYERSLSSLNEADDPWGIAATALAYVDALLDSHSESWERIESLLSLAAQLIEDHQLEPLRLTLEYTSCAYFVYQGEWAKLRDTQRSLIAQVTDPANVASLSVQLFYAALLDRWSQVLLLVERVELDNTDILALPVAKQWGAHYLSNALAQSGDIDGAIAQRISILDDYADVKTQALLPIAYGELALWQHIAGDQLSAHRTAMESISYAQQNLNDLTTCFGQLFVASFFHLRGDTESALPLLNNVLVNSRHLQHPILIFSTLYHLAHVHAGRLPPDLVLQIMKIGAVSPVMHFVLRPLARTYLNAQDIKIPDESYSILWATSAADVKLLLKTIEEALG